MARKRKAPSATRKVPPEQLEPEPVSSSSEKEEEEESTEVTVLKESEEEEEESSSSEEKSSSSEEESEPEPEPESKSESGSSSSSEEEDSEDDETSKREKIRKLLEPFSKDQIIQLFINAASKDASIISRVTQLADTDPTHRKIFVRGLSYDSTSEQLFDAFKPYGEIEEYKVITDKATGRAKGYGFVLFKTRVAAEKALKQPQKKIGNRTVHCNLAAKPDAGGRKIYVGNVGPNVNGEKLRAFFAKFGEIEEGPLGFDATTNKPKGFAIFVYKSVEGVSKALEEPSKLFDGCQLYCKKFVENINDNTSNSATTPGAANQVVPQNIMPYGFGMSPGMYGANMNAASLLMGQNMGFAGNPMLGYNQTGLAASGFPPSLGGIGPPHGLNAINPSMLGSYGSQAALQGLGAYQSALMGQSSFGGTAAMATATTPAKDTSAIGSGGATYPSFGR